ncbi:hypothetical protein TSUD_172860 [Trifolium subterraneum]|nr:hypothetical protein TSUD_172860 [Trifolium subterraneum]
MKAVSSTIAVQQISDTYDSRIVLSQGYKRLYDALQLLQADPAVKVAGLSSVGSSCRPLLSHPMQDWTVQI